MADGFKRVAALGAATVALTAGALLGTVGSASADSTHHTPGDTHRHCWEAKGHWAHDWQPAHWEHHRWHHGHWARDWRPAHWMCHRR